VARQKEADMEFVIRVLVTADSQELVDRLADYIAKESKEMGVTAVLLVDDLKGSGKDGQERDVL